MHRRIYKITDRAKQNTYLNGIYINDYKYYRRPKVLNLGSVQHDRLFWILFKKTNNWYEKAR